MKADERVETIREKLLTTFAPTACTIEDESAQHIGHAGAASGAGHYKIRLVCAIFEGKNRVERHRLVYDCLADMLQDKIHALSISAVTPSEIEAA